MDPLEKQAQGLAGVLVRTTTTPATGDFCIIQVIEAATFSAITETTAVSGSDAMTGFAIPANTILRGKFSSFTLASGKVRAYLSSQFA